MLPVDQALHVDGLDPDFLKSNRKTTHLDAVLKASIWRILCKTSVYCILSPVAKASNLQKLPRKVRVIQKKLNG